MYYLEGIYKYRIHLEMYKPQRVLNYGHFKGAKHYSIVILLKLKDQCASGTTCYGLR